MSQTSKEAKTVTAQQAPEGNWEVSGTPFWWAYVNGQMLRDKRGVGRRFKSEAAALRAGEAS